MLFRPYLYLLVGEEFSRLHPRGEKNFHILVPLMRNSPQRIEDRAHCHLYSLLLPLPNGVAIVLPQDHVAPSSSGSSSSSTPHPHWYGVNLPPHPGMRFQNYVLHNFHCPVVRPLVPALRIEASVAILHTNGNVCSSEFVGTTLNFHFYAPLKILLSPVWRIG